jgi:hypothetical protein
MFRSLCKSGPQFKCTRERYHVNAPTAFVPTGIPRLRTARQWTFYSKVFQTYLPRKSLYFRNPKGIWKRIYIAQNNQMKLIFTSKNCSTICTSSLIYSLPVLVALNWVRMEQIGSHWMHLHKIYY